MVGQCGLTVFAARRKGQAETPKPKNLNTKKIPTNKSQRRIIGLGARNAMFVFSQSSSTSARVAAGGASYTQDISTQPSIPALDSRGYSGLADAMTPQDQAMLAGAGTQSSPPFARR
jgi:hypothetical protein